MNVYDTANKLAQEIKQSEEYANYKKAKESIEIHPEVKKKIEEFEALRYETQIMAMQAGQADEEKTKKMQELYIELIQNDYAKDFFEAETKFNIVLADVNKIIGDAVVDVLK